MEIEAAPRWVRWGWWFTLVAVCVGTAQGILTSTSRPVDWAAVLLLPGLLALPWLGAAPAAFEGTRSWSRRFRLLALLATWVLVPLLPILGGLWAAAPPPQDDWLGLSWLLAVSLVLTAASAVARAGRSPHARLVLMGICGCAVLGAVFVWRHIESLTDDARWCLGSTLEAWPLRTVLCLGLIGSAALLDRRSRVATLASPGRARLAVVCLALVPVAALASLPRSRWIAADSVRRIWKANLTATGDLVLVVTLNDGDPVGRTVILERNETRLRWLSRRPDLHCLLTVAPDGSNVAFTECPSIWQALSCRACCEGIAGIISEMCLRASIRVVSPPSGDTVHSADISLDVPRQALPTLGPRGAWADGELVHLISGGTVDAPVGGEELVARWSFGDDLLFLRAIHSQGGPAVSLLGVDVTTGKTRAVGLRFDSRPNLEAIGPDGRFVVVRTDDHSTSAWWAVDSAGTVRRMEPPQVDEQPPLVVWGRDGQPRLGHPTCAMNRYEGVQEYASAVFRSDHLRDDSVDCRIVVDGVERPLRSVGASSGAQWLADSIVYVVEGNRVVRFWPDADRIETLFAVPEPN